MMSVLISVALACDSHVAGVLAVQARFKGLIGAQNAVSRFSKNQKKSKIIYGQKRDHTLKREGFFTVVFTTILDVDGYGTVCTCMILYSYGNYRHILLYCIKCHHVIAILMSVKGD